MPVMKDPTTPQIMVTPPSPEIYEAVNPSGMNITLSVEPKPMNVPSNIPKASNKKQKSLFLTTVSSVFPKFSCFLSLRLTRLGAWSGFALMTNAKPKAIKVTK